MASEACNTVPAVAVAAAYKEQGVWTEIDGMRTCKPPADPKLATSGPRLPSPRPLRNQHHQLTSPVIACRHHRPLLSLESHPDFLRRLRLPYANTAGRRYPRVPGLAVRDAGFLSWEGAECGYISAEDGGAEGEGGFLVLACAKGSKKEGRKE